MIGPLPNDQAVQKDGRFERWWYAWLAQIRAAVFGLTQSGTTANRPTEGLWVGRMYFDTTLGLPVWVQAASNPAVWVKADGTVV